MDRVFLDSNVLFSAAWRDGGRMKRLWDLDDVELITSEYAVGEARRNLKELEPIRALDALLRRLTLVDVEEGAIQLPASAAVLPQDDRPILQAAISLRASHLLTGNERDFGPLYGRRVVGVLILRPSTYLNAVLGR